MQITRRLLPFLVYAGGVFVGGILLAYPLWLAAQAAGFDALPFNKLCFRLLEALALVGLWPLLRALGLRGARSWGLGRGAHPASPLAGVLRGYLGGAIILTIVVASLMAVEVRVLRADAVLHPGALMVLIVKVTLAGAVIATIEEIWFRGALHSALESAFSLIAAISITSALYALVHFIRPDVEVPTAQVDWASGWTVITGAFGRFADPGIIDSLAALAAVGLLLSLVRHHTGRIWECIGLHAGFVAIIRTTRKLTEIPPDAPGRYLAGNYDGVIGLLGCVIFLLAALGYWILLMRRIKNDA